jgi:CheY-like chemotaxis protein
LLDIGMPKINGYDVAREIRARPEGGDVLLMRHHRLGAGLRPRAFAAAGFDHHLTKPVEPDTLIELLAPRSPAS